MIVTVNCFSELFQQKQSTKPWKMLQGTLQYMHDRDTYTPNSQESRAYTQATDMHNFVKTEVCRRRCRGKHTAMISMDKKTSSGNVVLLVLAPLVL